MAKGGKYLAKKPVAKKKKGKVLPVVLIVLAVLLVGIIGAGVWYYNFLLNQLSRPDSPAKAEASVPTETYDLSEETIPEATVMIDGQVVEETTPEDTWPVIVPDKNISNILLVGQASREGEAQIIADTMIICSINRETKTLTMTSLMRDMRLVWPEFIDKDGKSHTGNNRINMAYNMGYSWTQNKQDSMDVLESIVQHNFGIPVERTIEVDFALVEKIAEMLGGVEVELSQEEIDYLRENYPASNTAKTLEPGMCKLSPYLTLCYARMRKVGHGDYERTERQRIVITKMIEKLKDMNILKIHSMFTEILPMITTDMTNKEITNYAFEFIPMLKDLKIQSQRLPYDGNSGSIQVEIDGRPDNQLTIPDLPAAARWLQESIGMIEPTQPTEAAN